MSVLDVLRIVAVAANVTVQHVAQVALGPCLHNSSSGCGGKGRWSRGIHSCHDGTQSRDRPSASCCPLCKHCAKDCADLSPSVGISPIVLIASVSSLGLCCALWLVLLLACLARRRHNEQRLRRIRERAGQVPRDVPRNNLQFGLSTAEEELLTVHADPDPIDIDQTLFFQPNEATHKIR